MTRQNKKLGLNEYRIRNRRGVKNNSGFTLVEMVVVLAIITIMMSATVWGVTGWIAHYEYVSSEEKARTIYLGAQSALSAADSRGTLDEYMDRLSKEMRLRGTIFAQTTSGTGLKKEDFGIPIKKDNEGVEHEYGYLTVKCGDYVAGGGSNTLFKLLDTYVSDSEQLNGSIVIEFDITAKKVYSVFYSTWASSMDYSDQESKIRGAFHINNNSRKASYREDFAVGYYSSDQVNVVKLESGNELKVSTCVLHNEEKLYLSVNSTSLTADSDTSFEVDLYEKTKMYNSFGESFANLANDVFGQGDPNPENDDVLLCSFVIDRSMLGGYDDTPQPVELDVKDANGDPIGRYSFILSYDTNVEEDGEKVNVLSITLDALSSAQSMALVSNGLDENGRTVNAGYSITRLLGVQPKNIFARVTVEPKDADEIYVVGSSVDSNTENDMFATKAKDSEYLTDQTAFELSRCRHLSNIRYTEQYILANSVQHTYALMGDIDWKDGIIYPGIKSTTTQAAGNSQGSLSIGYAPLDTTKTGFPMIQKLNDKTVFDGKGNQITGLLITNESGVEYERNTDGTLKNQDSPVNMNKSVGLFGINKGTIKRLIVSDSKAVILSATENVEAGNTANTSIFSDSVEAAGLLCGRNEGVLRELYFDRDCEVTASVKYSFDDIAEAKDDGIESPESDDHLNEKYGCGVGMVAGTMLLKEDTNYDRIRTSGKVTGNISGACEVPKLKDTEGRKDIYDDENKDQDGKTNAQKYAYGTGGIFGYVYGEYNGAANSLGIGISEDAVRENKNKTGSDAVYLKMCKREKEQKTINDSAGNEITVDTLKKTDEDLFGAWDNQSIVNKADVKGSAFTGGIIGNIYITGLKSRKSELLDSEGDNTIPENAVAQLINCHNYGDATGDDFVGGVVGVNGEGGYITECASYGDSLADAGVSAGITSENYGYISKCSLERALADDDNRNEKTGKNENYIPKISGNMEIAGTITAVNQDKCVIRDCKCGVVRIDDVEDEMTISGNEMTTFGYLVGDNYGVVNGGKAGEYVGFSSKKTKMTIGGAVGTNRKTVKNVTVTAKLFDDGEAECIGGIAGVNLDTVKGCMFGGHVKKNKSVSRDTTIGGIAGRNGNGKPNGVGTIRNCYLIGARFNVSGICNFVESDSEAAKVVKSSAVGGVCGVNNAGSVISRCYITGLGEADSSGNAVMNEDGTNSYKVKRQSRMTVKYGMAGGVAAVNYGSISQCGYTGKVFYEKNDKFVATNDTVNENDMLLFEESKGFLALMNSDDTTNNRQAMQNLNKKFIDSDTGELEADIEAQCGYLTNDEANYRYALPKKATSDGEDSWNAYDAGTDSFALTLDQGKGYIGGIVGYNAATGSVYDCASGRWVVENYLPKATYVSTGGIIGTNTAEDGRVNNLINFAYVRTELPEILMSYIDNTGHANNSAPDNRFYYVGGVIGTQSNTTKAEWSIEKCVNAGTVLNYYGNNAGGVIGQINGMGGKVQYCYNYGTIMTGYTTILDGSNSGTAGGIVSHYTNLNPDQVNEVLDCQNHGAISFPAQGMDRVTCEVKDKRGVLSSNDVGGIVGEISAPISTSLYTVNIKNCVNGRNAKLYCASKCAGIVGQIGCFTKGNVKDKEAVNSVFVNIDSCRNYSSDLFSSFKSGSYYNPYVVAGGGITAGRDAYSDKTKITGYTTIRNCLSVRMNGNNKDGNYAYQAISNNNGILAFAKQNNPVPENESGDNKLYHNLKYCGNNYYLDESSFQYSEKRGFIKENGYDEAANGRDNKVKGTSAKVNALVADGEPADADKKTISKSNVTLFNNTVNKLSLYMDDFNRQRKASTRIVSVEYGTGANRKYALFAEPEGYSVDRLNRENAWISNGKIYINTETEDVISKPLIYYTDFAESGSSSPYSVDLINHFYLDRVKKNSDFKSQAESTIGRSLSGKVDTSRLPVADEYDINYYTLDDEYMAFIKEYQEKGPDTIYNVSVKKDDNYGYYNVTWKVRGEDGKNPSATEFTVEIRYIDLETAVDGEFDATKIDTYLNNNVMAIEPRTKTAYGTTTTFSTPAALEMEEGHKYYAIVRVKDARGDETNYSIFPENLEETDSETGETIMPYAELLKKLPTPEFEIVKYTIKDSNGNHQSKWMLHLKNADKFVKVAQSEEEFEVGAYALKGNVIDTQKIVKMTKDNIIDASGNLLTGELLNNAVDASKFATGTVDYVLYGYAKAKDCLDSDLYKFSVYVPQKAEPAIDYECVQTSDDTMLNNDSKKPEYIGQLEYRDIEKDNNGNYPPVPQTFKLELYGVKTEVKDGEVIKKWHETVASKEYSASVSENIEVNIGYYDVPDNVNLKEYDSFGVECWYAASGQGDVYNYFETTEERADRTLRGSGYITDLSGEEAKYYFHTAKLAKPEIKLVCMGRTPEWYAVLCNGDEYSEGTTIVMNGEKDSNAIINTATPQATSNATVNSLFKYAATVGTGTYKRWFKAKADGSLDSDKTTFSPTDNNVTVFGDKFKDKLYVNLGVTCDSYKDEEGLEHDGTFTLDENNKLNFKGTVKYSSHNTIGQYLRYEIYALDEKGQQVTLYISDDKLMESGRGTDNGYKNSLSVNDIPPIEIPVIKDANNNDINKYHDFHFAVWYSKADVNELESDKGDYFYHYCDIPESVAKSLACYNKDKDQFENARDYGLIIDVSGIDPEKGITKPRYIYATPLADKTYGDKTYTNNYKDYVLYREADETVTSINKKADGSDDIESFTSGKVEYAKWNMNSNYYGEEPVCDIDVKVYRNLNTAERPVVANVEATCEYCYAVKGEGTSPYRVDLNDDYTYDWNTYNYYAVVRVKDKSVLNEAAYSDSIVVKIARPLPKPELSVVLLGYDGDYIHLDNYEEYLGYPGNIKIIIKYCATPLENNEYVIDVNDGSYAWRKTKSGVPIRYTHKGNSSENKMDKHNLIDGSSFKLEGYAVEYEGDEIVNQSAKKFSKMIYTPNGRNPMPAGTKLTLSNSSVNVSDDQKTVTFKSDISFTCTASSAPKDKQGFFVALVGTPMTNVKGSSKQVILSRTDNKGLQLNANESVTDKTFTFALADDVSLNDFKDLYIYVWYGDYGADGYVYSQIEITEDEFNTYKGKDGVVVDCTDGISNAKYYVIRVFGYANERPTYAGENRGSAYYKIP